MAECKATKKKTGGDDLNKFAGVLERERRRQPDLAIQGYYISLGGFSEPARDQESEGGEPRFAMLDGPDAARELIAGRILVASEVAIGVACGLAGADGELAIDPDLELLAHDRGWVWCVYFTCGLVRTSFALVHASGHALGGELLADVVASDAAVGGGLSGLEPPVAIEPREADPQAAGLDLDATRAEYFGYLARGSRLDHAGGPARRPGGRARQIRLENLYVPLHLVPIAQDGDRIPNAGVPSPDGVPDEIGPKAGRRRSARSTRARGGGPAQDARLAILAAPGGGKSTLLKRLAVAYAFPERRLLTAEQLPDRAWLPLIVRCRQLESVATTPIREILASIAERAEMPQRRAEFDALVSGALVNGDVLLLVDGLDEIADGSDRVGFVKQLRTFLATYPGVSMVVTSRVAGFRVVGSALSHVCDHYRVSDFDDGDIESLTVAWHREVVGDTQATIDDARRLASRIVESDRVRRLASNPLLLTTLLLVKRWVGDLPRKRSVLYEKAIEVLLMTWNVEGHRPIDKEEALPQLAYVAFAMSVDGVQTISGTRLRELLIEARAALPEVLAYAQIPVSEFVRRIEDRSSVLSLTGHDIEAGRTVSVYEFKHLTFQEYLTALAVVDRNLPPELAERSIVDILEPHVLDESWRKIASAARSSACGPARRAARPTADRLDEARDPCQPRARTQTRRTPGRAAGAMPRRRGAGRSKHRRGCVRCAWTLA